MAFNWQWLLILLGIATTLLLLGIIRRQVGELRKRRDAQAVLQQRQQAQRQHHIESVQILARSILEDQVEISEGVIRLKVLLDNLAPQLQQQAPYQILSELYAAMAHMPTHQARQQTDKRFLHKLDQQRFKLEREHRDQVMAAARQLLQEDFNAHPTAQSAVHPH